MAKKRRSSQFKESSQVIDIEEARKKRQEKRQKQLKQQKLEEKMAAEAAERRATRARVKAGRRKKRIVYAVIILAIIAAIGTSILNIVALKADYNEAKAQNDQLLQQKKELEQQIKDSGKKEYIEKEARVQLRMVKPGETVYVVPYGEEKNNNSEESDKDDN